MGCSCVINNNESEIINSNPPKIEFITDSFQPSKYDSSLIKLSKTYTENISNISSTNNIYLTKNNKIPNSKINPQELISLLNTLPPLQDKKSVELNLPIKYENQAEY